jgi:hypothetical protein
MIDFSRAEMSDIATHYVGNFGLGEDMELTEKPYHFKDAVVREIFFNFLLSGFKNDIFYHFRRKSDLLIYDVKDSVDKIFEDREKLFEASVEIAHHLYRQSIHNKIRGGEMYVVYLKDMIVNGELCDAVGIFKSESKETYIKVDFNNHMIDIETDLGMSPNKLDKGVLIFNTDKNNGYTAVMVDNSNKIAEASTYWSKDFLDMQLKDSPYLNTSNYIDQCVSFCEEVLTEENGVEKKNKMMILNNSIKYFDNNDIYNKEGFEAQVLNNQKDLVTSFREHQDKFSETYGTNKADEFTISKTAVKKNSRFMKGSIKLDENFEITIKARHDFLEKGYDDERGMGFYKVYFVNEELK